VFGWSGAGRDFLRYVVLVFKIKDKIERVKL
jgi:hypothetical protein